ncbi:hypothetical protein G6F43_012294 [Rhizopus delemar]|nr:hypothetical protein G6F43_012294 [Rhizopus delemar]
MNATNNKVKCQCTKCSNCPEGFKWIAKKTANTHKRIDKVGEVLRQRRFENTFEQPTMSTERSTFEEFDIDADMDEEMTNDQQLEYLLVLYLVLFQAKHLSFEAGEDLLAFLSFFVRALGQGMEIPTKISTARNMINYSSASSGVSRFLVCSLCRSVGSYFALLVEYSEIFDFMERN